MRNRLIGKFVEAHICARECVEHIAPNKPYIEETVLKSPIHQLNDSPFPHSTITSTETYLILYNGNTVDNIAVSTLGANMRPYKYALPFTRFSPYPFHTTEQIND